MFRTDRPNMRVLLLCSVSDADLYGRQLNVGISEETARERLIHNRIVRPRYNGYVASTLHGSQTFRSLTLALETQTNHVMCSSHANKWEFSLLGSQKARPTIPGDQFPIPARQSIRIITFIASKGHTGEHARVFIFTVSDVFNF